MNKASFGDLVCETFDCAPEKVAETVFWHCLYPQATPWARLLWRLSRGYFAPDLSLIERVKASTSPAEIRLELSRYRYYQPVKGPLRKILKMRISGQRLLSLAEELFAKAARISLVF